MDTPVKIVRLGWLARLADICMVPLMYVLSGTFTEKPQRGHVWNKAKLKMSLANKLCCGLMVRVIGLKNVSRCPRWLIHFPLFSGWKQYVVLAPENKDASQEWYVGWILPDRAAYRRIKLCGPVRMLQGKEEVWFFGLGSDGRQIQIDLIGIGSIGDGSQFGKFPLL